MKASILIIILGAFAWSCATPEEKEIPFVIGQKDSLRSEILGEIRPYWVYVPPRDNDSSKKYSVLYLLDGDAHFHSVSGLIQILGTGINGTNITPEIMVVAIPNTNRTRDLTPTHSEIMNGEHSEFLKNSGGGEKFLKFIKDELIPRIDARYRTNTYRILVGHSLGGITAIQALYTMPETFEAYVAIDPSFWWDQRLLVKRADSILGQPAVKNKYLFLAQANTLSPGETTNEHFGAIKEFAKILESKQNPGLKWNYRYYLDDHHGSVPLIAEYDALRFIFADYTPSFEKIGMNPELVRQNFAKYQVTVPPEGVINSFGHEAMLLKDFDLAFLYFKMNTDGYPNSAWAFDSMGEFWMAKGDTTQAVANFKRSLELFPLNDHAMNMIKKMREEKKRDY